MKTKDNIDIILNDYKFKYDIEKYSIGYDFSCCYDDKDYSCDMDRYNRYYGYELEN